MIMVMEEMLQGVKNSLQGSKIKTIRIKVGKKTIDREFVKKYRKIFTRKNVGKKVTVS